MCSGLIWGNSDLVIGVEFVPTGILNGLLICHSLLRNFPAILLPMKGQVQ